MDTQFRCKNEGRRIAVRDAGSVNGIDYLEVASADQKTLKVFFIHDLPGPASPPPSNLAESNIVIEGGARTSGIRVVSVSSLNKELTVNVSEPGDFSIYTLRIVTSPSESEPPIGFDPYLSSVDFSFKVECPSEFDCEQVTVCPPLKLAEPEIDYLAKDYTSFRSLILDRLSGLMPGWRERNPADLQIALVELLAYAGDHLSYFQDAVATEAYLGTARQRVSVRRHARLLDYNMHDGANARVWVCVDVTPNGDAEGQTLPAGTFLLTRGAGADGVVRPADLEEALAERPVVFETLHDIALHAANSEIHFYTWSDSECCLPRGSTRATLRDTGLSLEAGDVLIFEEILSPTKGTKADADPNHRHAVRLTSVTPGKDRLDNTSVIEIEWHAEDALPFPLCLTALIKTTTGALEVKPISVARGNVVPADYGRTISGESLVPPEPPEDKDYRPQLRLTDITFRVPYDHESARFRPASSALDQDPREALPAVTLSEGAEQWIARRDLLNSDRFAAEFVVEMERDGRAHLRFGDGKIAGKKPSAGPPFEATYRVGNGSGGNVGPESITRVVTTFTGIRAVRNPLAARGGTDPETMEEVRQFAPQAFRIQERSVTEADWAEVAERHREVQKAAARFRWFGSWYTVLITIDRTGGRPVKGDEKFLREIEAHLNRFRIAGYDLEINDPVLVPLDVLLTVCVKPGYFRSKVKETLLKVFSNKDLEGGGRGFFHPDNFTFGQPVYLSRIYQTAMNVAGVASVEPRRFQRWRKTPNREIETGALVPASLEIIRLDNDPSFPENGKIDFEMHGGI